MIYHHLCIFRSRSFFFEWTYAGSPTGFYCFTELGGWVRKAQSPSIKSFTSKENLVNKHICKKIVINFILIYIWIFILGINHCNCCKALRKLGLISIIHQLTSIRKNCKRGLPCETLGYNSYTQPAARVPHVVLLDLKLPVNL